MEIQARSNEGELLYFLTLKEALDKAKERLEKSKKAHSSSPDEHDRVIWKISFTLPNGERVRLVHEYEENRWILRQIDDEIAEKLVNNLLIRYEKIWTSKLDLIMEP